MTKSSKDAEGLGFRKILDLESPHPFVCKETEKFKRSECKSPGWKKCLCAQSRSWETSRLRSKTFGTKRHCYYNILTRDFKKFQYFVQGKVKVRLSPNNSTRNTLLREFCHHNASVSRRFLRDSVGRGFIQENACHVSD